MSDEQLNKPKKERVFVVPATMQKYHMDKPQLLELGRGYEDEIEELEQTLAELKKAGMTAMSVCYQNRLNEINFQCSMIEKLLS